MNNQTTSSIISRAQGCLLGLATGDALGTTLEFTPKDSESPLTDLVGGGPFDLEAGEWTDDTSLALCLGESLLACQGFDPVDQLERYVRWRDAGHWSVKGSCFDIGLTTNEALQKFLATGEPFPGPDHERSAGNGSLMRLAPIALFYAQEKWGTGRASYLGGESSRTTHGERRAVEACEYYAALLVRALTANDKTELLNPEGDASRRKGGWHPELKAVIEGSYRSKTRGQVRGSGYVIAALEAALWAFWHTDNFRDGALLAVNLGEDADTTGAIYGQLAGAFYGVEGIPDSWREKIAWRAEIEDMAKALVAESGEDHPRLPSAHELKRICGLLPSLHSSEFSFTEELAECALYHPEVENWLVSLYETGAVQFFDWSNWARGHELCESPDAIAQASLRDCCRLLTCWVRQERFFSGALDGAWVSGNLRRVLERLAVLGKELRK